MEREQRGPGFYQALGRTIQVIRTDQGLDRKDLAERSGISYSYLAAIENGKKPPSSKVLFRIADALGLRSHELLASVESRWALQNEAALMERPTRRSAWFHAAGEAEAMVAPAAAAAGPPPDAAPERDPYPAAQRQPRSPARLPVEELWRLWDGLTDHDRDLVLDLARRLASRS